MRFWVKVPGGFLGDTPSMTIAAKGWAPEDPLNGWGPKTPFSAATTITFAKSATPSDRVDLRVGARKNGRTLVSGSVHPPRVGATVELAGRKFRSDQEMSVLVLEPSALQPIGPRLHRYGATVTREDGTFSAWVETPDRAALVARTTGLPGQTLAGVSCPAAPRDTRRIRRT